MSDTNHGTCGECGRTATSRRRLNHYCTACYARMRRTPGYSGPRMDKASPVERFLALIEFDASGCWLWAGPIASTGYAQFAGTTGHRFAYEKFVGPIPDGMQIDHVYAKGCRHRHCVNWVDHLEVVTPQENALRSTKTIAYRWATRTHCNNGHEFTEANTWWGKRRDNPEKTYRVCRTCTHERRAAQRKAAVR